MATWRSRWPVSGNPRRPRRLAAENLELAERWASPHPVGVALRVAGIVRGGSEGMDLLRRSVEVLEQSNAVLEHAASLTRAGGRAEAGQPARRRP